MICTARQSRKCAALARPASRCLQRRLRIGYSRAARLIDQMEADGVVGPDLGGSRGREVLPEQPKPNQATRSAG